MPYYEVLDNQLAHGASLANRKIWVNTKATGCVQEVFCCQLGKSVLGSIVITYALPTNVLITSVPEQDCLEEGGATYVLAAQNGVGTMRVYPFGQAHIFELTGELQVERDHTGSKTSGG